MSSQIPYIIFIEKQDWIFLEINYIQKNPFLDPNLVKLKIINEGYYYITVKMNYIINLFKAAYIQYVRHFIDISRSYISVTIITLTNYHYKNASGIHSGLTYLWFMGGMKAYRKILLVLPPKSLIQVSICIIEVRLK